ncbi:MAG: hypothetical protein PHH98_00570 [Candidatus Gracilibacteria bacterium]|nr:hypothetical protein [Candidatus Gracilibacteria bacterium]
MSENLEKQDIQTGTELVSGVLSQETNSVQSEVEQIINYTKEEKENIDDLMEFVHIIDDLILSGESFENSMEYNMFEIGYTNLSLREKLHFKDIYNDLRIRYLEAKIKTINDSIENGKRVDMKSLNNYKEELSKLKK